MSDTRLQNLRALLDRYGVLHDKNYSGYEDIQAYLPDGDPDLIEEPKEIGAWAAVTAHGEYFYVDPGFESRDGAELQAVEYVNDDIFAEIPVSVVNLDTGEEFHADYRGLRFTKQPHLER